MQITELFFRARVSIFVPYNYFLLVSTPPNYEESIGQSRSGYLNFYRDLTPYTTSKASEHVPQYSSKQYFLGVVWASSLAHSAFVVLL